MKSIATYPGGQVYEAHCFMPNILFRQVPIPQDPSKMSIHLAWRVPIDDENMLSYMVNRVPPFDDDMRMKMESSADYDERSEEHTSELQSLMRISYAVFCLKKKTNNLQYIQQQRTTPH